MSIFDKAKDLAGQHADKVNQGIDAVGDQIDQRTGGKYAGQVDQAQEAARNALGLGGQAAPAEAQVDPDQAGAVPGVAEQAGAVPGVAEQADVDPTQYGQAPAADQQR